MTDRYHTLTVDAPMDTLEALEALLYEFEALGLEIRDGLVPPLPGVRKPNAGEATVIATFGSLEEAQEAEASVKETVEGARTLIEEVEQKDWSVAWREQIRASTVGRLWIGPPWEAEKAPAGLTRIVIEPKMAFGTGDHGTTQLCLEAVDAFMGENPGATVLDVGTGTGVLAIAAKKLGASRVIGVDNDATSVELAHECAVENGAGDVELSGKTLDEIPGTFDLVLANILANTLIELAPKLMAHVGKRLVLAGVLVHQAEEVTKAFEAHGAKALGSKTIGEWIRLDFERAR